MPYVIAKKNGKRFRGNFVLTKTEVERLRGDRACYVVVNTTTRRASKIGGTCRTGRAQLGAGLLTKLTSLFKPKPKRHPMSRRIYIRPSGVDARTIGPGTRVQSMLGRSRQRRRRRRR